jgi:hypothetical protein
VVDRNHVAAREQYVIAVAIVIADDHVEDGEAMQVLSRR